MGTVLDAIKDAEAYPRLRQLGKLVPSIDAYKLNIIVRYLERSGTILIDSDGHIIWSRGAKREELTFADVAEFSPELKELLDDKDN